MWESTVCSWNYQFACFVSHVRLDIHKFVLFYIAESSHFQFSICRISFQIWPGMHKHISVVHWKRHWKITVVEWSLFQKTLYPPCPRNLNTQMTERAGSLIQWSSSQKIDLVTCKCVRPLQLQYMYFYSVNKLSGKTYNDIDVLLGHCTGYQNSSIQISICIVLKVISKCTQTNAASD